MGAVIAGLIFTILGSVLGNALASNRESTARKENFDLNEQAAQNADTRTRNLYNDLESPIAKINQLKDAGLSPSIYSGGQIGGSGVSSGAQGAGVSGVMPNVFGVSPLEAAQISLTKAQRENIEANTENIKQNTNVQEATVSNIYAQTAVAWKQAGATEAAEALTKAQTAYQEYENYIKNNTKDFSIRYAMHLAQKMEHEDNYAYELAREKHVQADIAENTQEEQENIIKQNLINLEIEAIEKHSNIKLNEEQKNVLEATVEKIQNDIQTAKKQLEINEKDAETRRKAIENTYEIANKELTLKLKEFGLKVDDTLIKYLEFTNKNVGNMVNSREPLFKLRHDMNNISKEKK